MPARLARSSWLSFRVIRAARTGCSFSAIVLVLLATTMAYVIATCEEPISERHPQKEIPDRRNVDAGDRNWARPRGGRRRDYGRGSRRPDLCLQERRGKISGADRHTSEVVVRIVGKFLLADSKRRALRPVLLCRHELRDQA